LFKNKGKLKIFFKRIWENYVNTYSIYSIFNKKPITKNMRDRKGRRYTFMGTHDGQEKKLKTS
jgi:hypothetical protein